MRRRASYMRMRIRPVSGRDCAHNLPEQTAKARRRQMAAPAVARRIYARAVLGMYSHYFFPSSL